MSPISLWNTLRRGPKAVRAQPEASSALTRPSFGVSASQWLAEKVGYLRDIDIFCDLTPEDMVWLAQATTMLTCQKGRVIYAPGETGEVLFLHKQGRVQIYRLSPEGKKLVVATLNAGTFFGEMALVGQGMYESFAEALEPALICALSRADLIQLLQVKPLVAVRILDVIGHRLVEAQAALEALAFRPVPARLAALLLACTRATAT